MAYISRSARAGARGSVFDRLGPVPQVQGHSHQRRRRRRRRVNRKKAQTPRKNRRSRMSALISAFKRLHL